MLTYLFAESWKPVLGGEVKEIQHGSAVAANGTVERIPDGPVDGVINRVQASNRDQRTRRTTQLGRKVEFRVIDHGRHKSERQKIIKSSAKCCSVTTSRRRRLNGRTCCFVFHVDKTTDGLLLSLLSSVVRRPAMLSVITGKIDHDNPATVEILDHNCK